MKNNMSKWKKIQLNNINGEEIVNKINDLPTNNEALKIDALHIKNLPKMVQNQIGGVVARNIYQMGDVAISGITNGQVLKWDDTNKRWYNGTDAGMTIGNVITGATQGSVLFAGASGVLAQDNANFFWDDTNNRFGIGTVSPATTLEVASTGVNGIQLGQDLGTASASGRLFFKNSTSTFAQAASTNTMLFTYGATIGSGTGTAVIAYNTSGNVGIGTTSINSTSRLEVYDGTAGNGLRVTRSTVTSQYIDLVPNNGTESTLISGGGNSKPVVLSNRGAFPIHFSIGGDGISNAKMSIASTGIVSGQDNLTDATVKAFYLSASHYTNAEEPLAMISGLSNATQGIVYIGGSSASLNTATDIRFFTASTNTTVTGTERMRVTSAGQVSIGVAAGIAQLGVANSSAGGVGFVLRGAAGQSANLVQFQDAAATVLSRVGADGSMFIREDYSSGTAVLMTFAGNRASYGIDSNADFYIDTSASRGTAFKSGAVTTMYVSSNVTGNKVGIGTSSPDAPLHIMSGTTAKLTLTTSDYVLASTGSRTRFGFGASTGNTYSTIQATSGGGGSTNNLVLQPDGGNVGIGTTTPTSKFHIASTVTGTIGTLRLSDPLNNNLATIGAASQSLSGTDGADLGLIIHSTKALRIGNSNVGNVTMSVLGTGQVGIGVLAPTATLQVHTLSAGTIGHVVRASASQTANLLEWQNSSGTILGQFTAGGNLTMASGNLTVGNGNASIVGTLSLTGGYSSASIVSLISNTMTASSGASVSQRVASTYSPTSGTGTYTGLEFSGTINQTGGANGITRGIYINPTLTSAADFRAIDVANNSGYGIYQSGASATNYFAGAITSPQVINTANAITATANAATIPVTSKNHKVTNNSAATLTITLATSGAVDMQQCIVQILDFSAVAQTLTFVNTENSTVSVPATTNGSTSLPLTVGFIFNASTSKWRCVASS